MMPAPPGPRQAWRSRAGRVAAPPSLSLASGGLRTIRAVTSGDPPHGLDDAPDWYRDAVIYELHVRSFSDATATASATSAG